MDSTNMHNDNAVLPAIVGGLVTILLELKDNWDNTRAWINAIISGFISVATAYYVIPAFLLYLHYRYQSDILLDARLTSLAGFIGGILGGKLINVLIYVFDRYSKRAATKAADKFLGDVDAKNELDSRD